MRFDQFMEDVPQNMGDVLEDGDHVCEITGEKEWVSQDGARQAVIVTFAPVNGLPSFDKFLDPSDQRDDKAAKQLLSALGLPTGTDVGSGAMKGKRVTVTTKRAADKAGEPVFDKRTGLQRLWINGFSAAKQVATTTAEPELKKSASLRTPASRVKESAPAIGSDDVPF